MNAGIDILMAEDSPTQAEHLRPVKIEVYAALYPCETCISI